MRVFRRNKKWWIDYSRPDGTRKRRPISPDRKVAELALNSIKVKFEKAKALGIEQPLERMKLREFSKLYIETYSKPNKITWDDDEYHAADFLDFFDDIYLEEITPMKIERFKQWRLEQGVKQATVNRALACLRCMLNRACEWNYP